VVKIRGFEFSDSKQLNYEALLQSKHVAHIARFTLFVKQTTIVGVESLFTAIMTVL